jgi:hypothetical protein
MSRVYEKIASAKEVFRVIDQDLGKIPEAGEIDKLAIVQRLRVINEELSDMVLTLVKNNEALKIRINEKGN